MIRHIRFVAEVALLAICSSGGSALGQSSAITYQGRLEQGGVVVPDGPRIMTFRFWPLAIGGVALETVAVPVQVQGGLFTAAIPVNPQAFSAMPRYVSVEVNGQELTRQLMTAMPYSLNTRGISVDGSGRVGIGTATPAQPLHVVGQAFLQDAVRIDGTVAPDGEQTLMVYSTTPLSGAASIDGFRFRRDDTNITTNRDYFVFEKTDGNDVDPDGGFAWVMRGSDNVAQTAMVIDGAGHVGIGNSSPIHALSVESNVDGEYAVLVRNPHARGQGIRIQAFDGGGTYRLLRIEDRNASLRFEVNADGLTTTRALRILGGADLAEKFDISAPPGVTVEPGSVVSIDRGRDGRLRLCDSAYDTAVAGVISGAKGLNPGMVLSAEGDACGDGSTHVAMSGRVWVWCDASFGPIARGDRLTSSAVPGHAMRVSDSARADGAVIGKAMSELRDGRGLVLVLVNLQ
ncbi:MAG: hypothetical protein JSR77_15250 [Planctomycetes bacterium]|nr:hypothetical protein [Planctomycetota bacterium]